MQISYDQKYNIAYIRLREKTIEVETLRISEELNIDISPDGKIYGIELLNANEQFIKGEKLTFTDESTGKTVQFPLSVEQN